MNDFILKATVTPVPIEPFSLIVGDIVHNLRCALDHLAFSLAVPGQRPNNLSNDVAQDSQFPIVGDEDRKGNIGRGAVMFRNQTFRIRGMDPRAQTIIEELQPYKDGADFVRHPLWWLHYISNVDKHRFVPVVSMAAASGFTIRPFPSDWSYRKGGIEYLGGPIETDTGVARINTRAIYGEPKVDVNIRPTLGIAFADGPVAKLHADFVLAEKFAGNKKFNLPEFPRLSAQVFSADALFCWLGMHPDATSTPRRPKGNCTRARMRPEERKQAKAGFFVTSFPDLIRKERIGLVTTT